MSFSLTLSYLFIHFILLSVLFVWADLPAQLVYFSFVHDAKPACKSILVSYNYRTLYPSNTWLESWGELCWLWLPITLSLFWCLEECTGTLHIVKLSTVVYCKINTTNASTFVALISIVRSRNNRYSLTIFLIFSKLPSEISSPGFKNAWINLSILASIFVTGKMILFLQLVYICLIFIALNNRNIHFVRLCQCIEG